MGFKCVSPRFEGQGQPELHHLAGPRPGGDGETKLQSVAVGHDEEMLLHFFYSMREVKTLLLSGQARVQQPSSFFNLMGTF